MKREEVLILARAFYPKSQVEKLEKAINFASVAHEGQFRRSGEPYITHPLAVAHNLIEWGMDIDSVIAGVLHDIVEDTNVTLKDIKENFSNEIAKLVDGVTKVSQARSGMKDISNYMDSTKENLSKLLIAVADDVRVVIIKLSDRLHNMQTLKYKSPEKQIKIARETLAVFAPMADRLGMGRVRMQLEELAFSYLDPKEYKRLSILMRKRLGKSTRKLGIIRNEVETKLKAEGIKYEVNGRIKSIYSLHKKMIKKKGNIDEIYDLMALRVILDTKEDCYRVLGILHSMYQPMIARIKDYIAIPKPNGYQSLHTTVVTPNKQIVEFQIRTKEMHEYAEKGLAASFHYHASKSSENYTKKHVVTSLPANLQWITRLQEVAEKLGNNEDIPEEQLKVDLFSDRIFVYSPKGDIFNLPIGALPLDFAYLVHSDVGKHAHTFKVNGQIRSFDTPLENGDVVEIITRRASYPNKGWLKLVTTSHAKDKLKSQLKHMGILGSISKASAIIREKALRKKPITDKNYDKDKKH